MLLRIKMVLIQVVFALICNLQLVSTGLADVSVTVDVSSTTDVYPNFSTIDSAWNHILKLQFGSPYTSAVIRFLPGTYVIAHNLTRTFANMSIRHVADTPNTVTLVTPLMTSTADVPTLVEMGNGTNSYLEFTNLTVAIPDNGMFHLTMTGNNATMNVTNCLFEGAGYYSRLTLRVGHLDINRASQFISTNNILRNLAPDIAVYRIAGAHIKGGGAYQMFRYQGAPLKAESGPVLIEDYEARNYTWSQNPVFQYLNKYRATWKSYQLRMRNVTISGPLLRIEGGNTHLSDIFMARNNNYGPYLGVQQSERSLVRVQADSEILLENFNAIDHELDMGFDLALATGAKFTFRNGNIKNLTARHCAKLSYGSISIEGSTIENSNCTYVLAKVQLNRSTLTFQNSTLKNSTCVDGATLFDVSGSSLIINNTLVEGTRSPRGAVFIARDAAEFVFTNSALSNSYAYRSLISIDISSTVKISNSAVKSNTAQFRDLILIDSHGGNTVLNNNTFEDNTSVQESFIKISPGVNLVLSNSTFHRNRKPLSIDSLSAISIEKCMFTQNSAVINSRGNTTVKDSTFRHNIAATDSGGAIAHVPGHTSAFLVISNTVFDTNVADIDGGAIFLDSPKFDPIKLVNVTFKGNSAKRGGAMFQAQSQWANKGLGGYASSAFEGNTAEWQGNDFATGIKDIVILNTTALSTESGNLIGDLIVRSRDAYGNTFRPPRSALLKVYLTAPTNTSLLGETTKYLLSGESAFPLLRFFAVAGKHNLTVAPDASSLYNSANLTATITVQTLPCTELGKEERPVEGTDIPACVTAVCTNGCLTDFGYCRADFCVCTDPSREGINCGLTKNARDTLSFTLPSNYTPTAANRDTLLSAAQSALPPGYIAQFRSLTPKTAMTAQSSILARRSNDNIFTVAVTTTGSNPSYIENDALQVLVPGLSSTIAAVTVGAGVDLPVQVYTSPKQTVPPSNSIVIFFLVMAAISITFSIIFAVLLFVFRQNKAVKASSLVFSQMIIVGSVLGYSLIFLYIGQLSTAICMSQVWLGGVAFALAVGNLIGKNWRIYKIFNTRGKTQAVKDHHVLMVTFGILFIELAIDAIWTGVSPLQPTLKETGSGRYYTCDSDHVANMPMTAISLLYKTILLLTACSLAFLTRNVDMLYGESKAIGVSSYAMLLSGGIIIPLVFLPQTDAQTAFYLKSTGILVSGLVTTFALFWPKLYLTVLNETGIDSFLRSGTRRSSRSRKGKTTAVSSGGGGSSGGNQDTMMAQSMQARTEEQAKEDDRIVKTPNVCTLYQKGGMNGRLRKCEVVMDPAQGIILFAVMSENSQLNFPGVSFRLEHLSSCSWDPQEHSLILQAGDNSLQVTFQSTRILQAYVNEMSAKLVGKDATVSTPASFMSAFRTSRIG